MKRLPIILLAMSVGVLAAVLVFTAGSSDEASAVVHDIDPGYDLFQTVADGDTRQDFSGPTEMPGAMFNAATGETGCDNFIGSVPLKGVPLGTFGGYSGIGDTDTVVRRADPAGPFPDLDVAIEIVALSLQSVAPFTVTGCTGGDQQWEMTARVNEAVGPPESGPECGNAADDDGDAVRDDGCPQTPGSMQIDHEYPDGGTVPCASVILPVRPLLTFTRVGGPGLIPPDVAPFLELPLGTVEPCPKINWCHNSTGNDLDDPAGQTLVNVFGLTSNFNLGVKCPDSPQLDGSPPDGKRSKRVVKDQDIAIGKYHHKIDPAELPTSVGGTTELLVGGSDAPASASDGSGGSFPYVAVVAAGALALAAGGLYARRRWMA